ncbi:MAG: hypothetical protein AVDCRST_MAG83-865, partial [uncultured Arthrobacter sp.]
VTFGRSGQRPVRPSAGAARAGGQRPRRPPRVQAAGPRRRRPPRRKYPGLHDHVRAVPPRPVGHQLLRRRERLALRRVHRPGLHCVLHPAGSDRPLGHRRRPRRRQPHQGQEALGGRRLL